jgi:hypothetical protein
MRYTCPVCGYDKLTRAPRDYMICPCCGTEFGYDDFAMSHEELRQEWLRAGAPWFSDSTPRPPHWSAVEQLRNIGYEATEDDLVAIYRDELTTVGRIVFRGQVRTIGARLRAHVKVAPSANSYASASISSHRWAHGPVTRMLARGA